MTEPSQSLFTDLEVEVADVELELEPELVELDEVKLLLVVDDDDDGGTESSWDAEEVAQLSCSMADRSCR